MREAKPGNLYDRLVEAGWLFCAAVVPLLVDPFADKPFEPAKAFLLRWIVAGMALAWAAGRLRDLCRAGERPARRSGLGWSVAGLAAANVLSAAFSILPARSFLGSDNRVQGAVTLLAFLSLFALVATGLRSRAQVARLLLAVSAASLPASLYAVAQAFGMDPVPWADRFGGRVFSTLGNPIPAGAYFALALFATVAAGILLAPSPADDAGFRRRGLPFLLSAALLVQLAGLALSGSRGPWMGLGVGAGAVFFGRAVAAKRGALAVALAGLFAAAAVFGWAALAPGRPAGASANSPAATGAGTGGVRLLLWQGAARVFFSPAPLWSPAGADRHPSWRPWVGYGAETFPETYAQHASPELNRLEVPDVLPDRAHNETWDLLCGSGIVGLSAWLLFLGAVLGRGLNALGGERSPAAARLAVTLPVLGGWGGGLACWWGGGPEWIGPGVFAGFLAGFLVAGLLWLAGGETGPSKGGAAPWLTPVLLGGLVCHLVEVQLAPDVVATRLLFLLLAAVLCSWRQWGAREGRAEAGRPASPPLEPRRGGQRKDRSPARERSRFSLHPGGILAGLAGAAFLFPFLARGVDGPGAGDSFLLIVLLLGIGGGLAALLLGAAFPAARSGPVSFLASFALPAFSVWAVLSPGGLLPPAAPAADLPQAEAGAAAFLVYLALLLVWGGVLALRLPGLPRPLAEKGPARPWGCQVAGLAALAAILAGGGWLVRDDAARLRADTYFKKGEQLFQQKQWADSAVFLGAAARACPRGSVCWLRLGDALWEKAVPAMAEKPPGVAPGDGPGDLRDLPGRIAPEELRASGPGADLALAQAALGKARQDNPYHFLPPLVLGKLYSPWALTETDPGRKRALAERAGGCFAASARLYPAGAEAWTEWGKLLFWVEGQTEEAGRMAERALALRADYPPACALKAEILLSRKEFSLAAAILGKLPPGYPGALEAWDALAGAAYQARDLDSALAATRRCLELDPDGSQAWLYHRNLAALHVEKGDRARAAREAQLALPTAPAAERPALEALLAAGGK